MKRKQMPRLRISARLRDAWWTAEPFSSNFSGYFEKEQEKRFKKLLESKDTAWRVTEKELARNAHYGKYKKLSDEMIRRTDTPYAPWYVIDAKEKSGTALMVIKTVADVLEKALEKKRAGKEAEIFEKPVPPDRYEKGILAKADLTKRLEEAEYRKKTGQAPEKTGSAPRRTLPSADPGDPWL